MRKISCRRRRRIWHAYWKWTRWLPSCPRCHPPTGLLLPSSLGRGAPEVYVGSSSCTALCPLFCTSLVSRTPWRGWSAGWSWRQASRSQMPTAAASTYPCRRSRQYLFGQLLAPASSVGKGMFWTWFLPFLFPRLGWLIAWPLSCRLLFSFSLSPLIHFLPFFPSLSMLLLDQRDHLQSAVIESIVVASLLDFGTTAA